MWKTKRFKYFCVLLNTFKATSYSKEKLYIPCANVPQYPHSSSVSCVPGLPTWRHSQGALSPCGELNPGCTDPLRQLSPVFASHVSWPVDSAPSLDACLKDMCGRSMGTWSFLTKEERWMRTRSVEWRYDLSVVRWLLNTPNAPRQLSCQRLGQESVKKRFR